MKKSSVERLTARLIESAYAEVELAKMSRQDLMETWLEILSTGDEKVGVSWRGKDWSLKC